MVKALRRLIYSLLYLSLRLLFLAHGLITRSSAKYVTPSSLPSGRGAIIKTWQLVSPTLKGTSEMNPLTILGVVLPMIEQLPTVEAGIASLFAALKAMIDNGLSAQGVMGAAISSLPALTAAVVANTPHAPAPPAMPSSAADALNAAEAATGAAPAA